jgi:site-specific DNA-methyltransferase (adenine-specific)
MTPYYQDDLVTIYHGDCREWMPEADVIVTDPPYGTGTAPRGGERAGTIDLSSAEWPEWDIWDTSWAAGWSGPMAVFCGIRRVYELGAAIGGDGLLIYVKSNPSPFGSSYEPCVTRGFNRPLPQHFTAYNAFNGQEHPTQKPIEVMRWIVGVAPVGVVLDPFMGSGTTLRAAKDLNRRAIGIEIEERYCEIAATRCSQEVLGLST